MNWDLLAPMITGAFLVATGASIIRIVTAHRQVELWAIEELTVDHQVHAASIEAQIATHQHSIHNFRYELGQIRGQIAGLTTPTLAEVSVQPGALRRSIGGPVGMHTPGEGEFFVPVRQPLRNKAGCVVSFSGPPDPNDPAYDRRPIERARAESCAQTEPFLGRTPAEAAENLRIKLGHCPHGLAEEVRLITGEIVAAVCPTCLEVLPAAWVGSDWRP